MVSVAAKRLGASHRTKAALALGLVVLAWIAAAPQSFVNLWLTPDQQGRIWFQLGDYERASRTFDDPRWRGFSLYAGEDFATAERYFSQYQDAESRLARANALAHQMDYKGAKAAYEELASRFPDHPAPAVNLPVMEKLIAADKQLSDSQKNESGVADRKPGDGTESSEEGEGQARVELEQLSADQLLQDPGLTEMWLRQIQRDPSEFLSTKFYLQVEQNEEDTP